jgi:hypothetical protein
MHGKEQITEIFRIYQNHNNECFVEHRQWSHTFNRMRQYDSWKETNILRHIDAANTDIQWFDISLLSGVLYRPRM